MSDTDPTASAHWPPGWSRNRLVNSTSSELLDLPDAERNRMYDSLREILGPEGFRALLNEMSANYKARLAAEEKESTATGDDDDEQELPPHLRASFLATLRRLYPDEAGLGKWGFVVYRLAYGDERQWAAFRERWDEILSERLRKYDGVPGVAEAMQQLKFRWIDERELEGASLESVARNHAVRSIFNLVLFAVAVDKWLGMALPSDQDAQMQGSHAEFEDSGASQTFDVAVETLLDELFTLVRGNVMSPSILAVGLWPKQVWVSGVGRHGVFEMRE